MARWEVCHAPFEDLKIGEFGDFPVVKNPPCNSEGTGSIPVLGTKIPHAKEQLSSEPQVLSPRGGLGVGFSYVS